MPVASSLATARLSERSLGEASGRAGAVLNIFIFAVDIAASRQFRYTPRGMPRLIGIFAIRA
ncbi:MAG: hypothetical protein KatS3mg059_1264 [Thermomicrobiales bacterium]|nr:MAG: hypothetical protein KatS3mg059_1264 [Thermomicrobiales bacterium]